ncbi:MAG: PIG-L deacetylase family protein [Actinomycetota bacterium]
MRLTDEFVIERALVVFAYPSAGDFGSAGTVAAWTKEGVEVVYVVATDAEAGANDPDMTAEKMREIRRAEQLAAANVLGVKDVVFLGFDDGSLDPTPELRKAIAREIRRHRPDVVIAPQPGPAFLDIMGQEYLSHPDHPAVGEATLRAIVPDASTRRRFPELWTEEGLEPHKPKLVLLQGGGGDQLTIDISQTIDQKVEALLCHVSAFHDGSGPIAKKAPDGVGDRLRMMNAGNAESYRLIRLF